MTFSFCCLFMRPKYSLHLMFILPNYSLHQNISFGLAFIMLKSSNKVFVLDETIVSVQILQIYPWSDYQSCQEKAHSDYLIETLIILNLFSRSDIALVPNYHQIHKCNLYPCFVNSKKNRTSRNENNFLIFFIFRTQLYSKN